MHHHSPPAQGSEAGDHDGRHHDVRHHDGHDPESQPDDHSGLLAGHHHPTGIRGFFSGLFVPHSHDVADSVDDAVEASVQGVRAVKMSLVLLTATAILQGVIVVISGSVALLADTIHNLADALTAIPLWVAFVVGRRAASRRYTYGYGRIEDLAGLFIVAMITLSAAVAGVESVRRFIEPHPVSNLGWVLAAGLVGFAGNEVVAVYRIRIGRRIGSAALVADGMHARADGFTSLAVILGVVGIWAGFPLADPLVGLLISVAIFVLLFGTARDISRRLLDGVDPALVEQAERTFLQVPGIISIVDVRLRWLGHRLSVDATVATDPSMPIAHFHTLEHDADHAIRAALPRVGVVRLNPTVHAG